MHDIEQDNLRTGTDRLSRVL